MKTLSIFLLVIAICFSVILIFEIRPVLAVNSVSFASNTITVLGNNTWVTTRGWNFWDLWNASSVNLWNVSWNNQNNNTQFLFSCKIVIGDGTTLTYFADRNVQVTFFGSGSAGGSNWFDVKLNATVTLGALVSASTYVTDSGIAFLFNFTSNYAYINADTGAILDLYSCSVSGIGCISRIKGNGIRRIWNFIGNRFRIGQITNANADFSNLYIAPPNAEYGLISPLTATMNTIIIRGTPSYLAYFAATCTITNLAGSGATTKSFDMGGSASMYLINSVLDAWTFNWASDATSKLFRQYTFDLQVTYQNGTEITGANVTIYNNTALIGSWITNTTGQIPKQTLSIGFYNKTGADTIYSANPFVLTITANGTATYTQNFSIIAPNSWIIAMNPDTSGDLVAGFVLAFALSLSLGIVYIKKRRN